MGMGMGMGLGMDGDPPLESGHVGGAARRGRGAKARGGFWGARPRSTGASGGPRARDVSAPAGGERGVQRPRAERAWVPATGAPTERHLVLLSPRQ